MKKTLHTSDDDSYEETYNDKGKELAQAVKLSLSAIVKQLVRDGYSTSEIRATVYEETSFLVASEVIRQGIDKQRARKRAQLMLVDDELVAEIAQMREKGGQEDEYFPIVKATKRVRSKTGLPLVTAKLVAEKIKDGKWDQREAMTW
jgi:hypothetical protein